LGLGAALDRTISASLLVGEVTLAIAIFAALGVIVRLWLLRGLPLRRARVMAILEAARDGERYRPPKVKRSQAWLFLEVWNAVYERDPTASDASIAKSRLRKLLGSTKMASFAVGHLRVRRLEKRLIAIATVGALGDRGAIVRLETLADDGHPVVSLAAAMALVRIDRTQLRGFIDRAARRIDWSPLAIERILRANEGLKTLFALSQMIDVAAVAKRPRLIGFLAGGIAGPTRRYLRTMLQTELDEEIIAACLRVLGTFGDPDDAETIVAFLASSVPHVRMRAADALGRIGRVDDAMLVRCLLSDTEWWVRYRSAEALVRMAEKNHVAIRMVAIRIGENDLPAIVDQVMEDLRAERAMKPLPKPPVADRALV